MEIGNRAQVFAPTETIFPRCFGAAALAGPLEVAHNVPEVRIGKAAGAAETAGASKIFDAREA